MAKRVMKNFSEEEEAAIRAFLFTNPGGNVSLVYPQPLIAGEELSPLMAAYSRTHIPFQDRTLQFLDTEKTDQTRAFIPHIQGLVEIFRNGDGSLKVSRRTGNFNREWVLAHGHSSIKEETPIFGYVEHISDIAGKRITGHPLISPQVKSTRYLSYGKVLDLALKDPDILALPDSAKFLEHLQRLHAAYQRATEQLTEAISRSESTARVVTYLSSKEQLAVQILVMAEQEKRKNPEFVQTPDWIKETEAKILKSLTEEAVKADVGKFVLDSTRNYLPAATRTSMGFSVNARALEEIITDLISSPRLEDRTKGQELWAEARKIAPVLLGEKSHIQVDSWRLGNETELRTWAEAKFGKIPVRNNGKPQLMLVTPRDIEMYTDNWNAAQVVFQYTDCSITDIMAGLTTQETTEVLERAHKLRGERDIIHPAIAHGGLVLEMTLPYHAYRDMYRHRRGSRTTQLLTTRLGFETPEAFTPEMKAEYAQIMGDSARLYEQARKHSPHTAEKLVPFGAISRALHSWQVNQLAYVAQLRGSMLKGNRTYVLAAHELTKAVAEVMPETARQFKQDARNYPASLWKKGYEWYDQTQRGKK